MTDAATAVERAAVDDVVGQTAGRHGQVAVGGWTTVVGQRTLLLPALHALQDEIGWISRGGLNYVCERLSVPPADAYGVATFYALLATAEQPERIAHVCDDIACERLGSADLMDALGTREDVHPSPCLGQCDRGPAVLVQVTGGHNVVIIPATASEVQGVLDGGTVDEPTPPPVYPGSSPRLLVRIGSVDPESLEAYRAADGFRALQAAFEMGPEAVVEQITTSRLRGRGGAAFPAGVKWEAVASSDEDTRYVICNADESEPGTFKDRVLLEGDPFAVVEAMTIAGFAVGATRGYVYVREEYPLAQQRLHGALEEARAADLLGDDIAGSGFDFDIDVRRGAGAYICGEETALFNSIEGFRGEPRQKPPFPTEAGLFAKPTLVNNVETLTNVPWILRDGAAAFASVGTEGSTGTKLFSISGDVSKPGVYEVAFGTTLRRLIDMAGGVDGEMGAVLLGGAAGAFVTDDDLDVELTFEGTRDAGLPLGSGSIVVFNTSADFERILARIAHFFADESCGQCVPCRVGTVRQVETLDRLFAAGGNGELETLADLDAVMRDASICGLGQFASTAVQSALRLGLIGIGS